MSTATTLRPRMKNPAVIIPEAMPAIQALHAAAQQGGVPATTLELVHLRASQINGCSFCVDSGARHAKQAGEIGERLLCVAAWREAPYFTDAERAALALTEAATRLSDRADPV
jgi:AhpD family alkylhydroperoxidase